MVEHGRPDADGGQEANAGPHQDGAPDVLGRDIPRTWSAIRKSTLARTGTGHGDRFSRTAADGAGVDPPQASFAAGAGMPNSSSAFSPMILRLVASGRGSLRIAFGWSKSWCGQSEAKRVRFSPP